MKNVERKGRRGRSYSLLSRFSLESKSSVSTGDSTCVMTHEPSSLSSSFSLGSVLDGDGGSTIGSRTHLRFGRSSREGDGERSGDGVVASRSLIDLGRATRSGRG